LADEGLRMSVIVLAVIVAALVVDFTNGFHDMASGREGRQRSLPDRCEVIWLGTIAALIVSGAKPIMDGGRRMFGEFLARRERS
jgi:hypothetical protein